MAVPGLGSSQPAFLLYVLAFGIAGIACLASVPKARAVVDAETQRGLTWLLLLCGGWASAHVGFLLASSRGVQTAFYVGGLIIGFAAIGAWLYFCSAYTGRTYHRNPTFRWSALGLYLGVVALKVTNPLHGLYFSTRPTAEPFALDRARILLASALEHCPFGVARGEAELIHE